MYSSGTFLKFLEKKSIKPISINQMKDLAKYLIDKKFNNKSNTAVVFCNNSIKDRVRRNIYLSYIRKFGILDCYLVYSRIVSKKILGENWETFFIIFNNNKSIKVKTVSAKNPKHWGVLKIISGGQTGADMGGLMAGKMMKMNTGGFAPKCYNTENGFHPELVRFGLSEHKSSNYWDRTLANVLSSDATIIFGNRESKGSKLTIKYCQQKNKPYKIIRKIVLTDNKKRELIEWFLRNDVMTLNIAGNRESVNKGIEQRVFIFLVKLLSRNNLVKDRAKQIVDKKLYNELYQKFIEVL